MDLALFDFDGTITTRGAYPDFLQVAVRPRRRVVGVTVLFPFIIGYRAGMVSEPMIRKLLEIKKGRHTGRYVRGDCDGPEKARRIRERIALDEYATIYAYGDRAEDREMLALANRRYLCWEEIQDLPATWNT
jgi:phosphoserine phosphatase